MIDDIEGSGPRTESIFDTDGALSREFLLKRGYCCENGCRNCPYGLRKQAELAEASIENES